MSSAIDPRSADATSLPDGGRRPSSIFAAFRHREFRLMWFGAFLSTTGMWMQTVAQSWVVLSLTGSALYLGFDAFLATLPMILFSLFGGVFADRIDRRKLLLVSQYLQMAFAIVLAILLTTEAVRVWHIFVLSFLTGTVQAFGGPAYQALLPVLVDREDVPNAIALNSMQFNLARMIGPILAGITMATLGAALCFWLNGLSFLAVIVTLLMIRTPFTPRRSTGTTVLEEMREGFRFLDERKEIKQLSLLAFTAAFFGIPLLTMMPVVAKEIFSAGPTAYSWLMAASGAGSVVGALGVAAVSHRERRGKTALVFQLSFALLLFGFALSHSLPLSLLIVFFTGATLLGVIATTSSLVQLATTEEMRGRMMSIFMLAFRGGMPLGNLASGWMAETISVSAALVVNGAALAVVSLSFLIPKTTLRDL